MAAQVSLRDHFRNNHVTLDVHSLFILFAGPKCGGTSIRRGTLRHRAINDKDSPKEYFKLFDSYTDADIDNMFKFAVVRNPFDRVVSAFAYLHRKQRIPHGTKFRAFVLSRLAKEGAAVDPHFQVLSDVVIRDGAPVFDMVAKLETIKADWDVIARKIRCHRRLPKRNKTKHLPYRSYYDDDTKAVVAKLYAADLEHFDYEF